MVNKKLDILKELECLIGGRVTGLVLTQGDESEPRYHGLRVEMQDGTIRDLLFTNPETFSSEGSFSILEIPAANLKNSRSKALTNK